MSVLLGSGNDFYSKHKVVSLKILNDVEYEKAKITCDKLHKSCFLITIITALLVHWNNQNPTNGL